MKLLDPLFSDVGESTFSMLAGVLTFFGLDKFIKVDIDNVFIHEIITGFIKMGFSIITAVIIYYILEYLKNKRNGNTN